MAASRLEQPVWRWATLRIFEEISFGWGSSGNEDAAVEKTFTPIDALPHGLGFVQRFARLLGISGNTIPREMCIATNPTQRRRVN